MSDSIHEETRVIVLNFIKLSTANHSRLYNVLPHLYTTFQITTNTIIINETYSF